MNSATTGLFKQMRDAYFLDPHDPATAATRLTEAAQVVIEGVVGRKSDTTAPAGLHEFASLLATSYIEGMPADSSRGPAARYFDHLSVAQLHPSGFKPAILAALASIIANNNTIIDEVSGLETGMEQLAVQWLMTHIAGFDPAAGSGLLVTGGTLANIHALAVARCKLEQQHPKLYRQTLASRVLGGAGLAGRTYKSQPALLFGTSMAHYSIQKAAGLLGPQGMLNFKAVALEERGYKMDPLDLEKQLKKAKRRHIPVLCVVAVAGETETGVVDDISAIADITEKYGVYLHVDAAYGGPFRLSCNKKLFKGIERADSVTVDPHKYMYTPYAAGAILFKKASDHALLKGLNVAGASYMFQEAKSLRAQAQRSASLQRYLGEWRIEGSMGGQAAAMVYASIKTLGADGLGALLDHTLAMTKLFAAEMADCPGLVPAHKIELNTICFRADVDRRTLTPDRRKQLDDKIDTTLFNLEKKYGIYLRSTDLPCPEPELRKRGIKEKVVRAVFTHPYTGQNEVKYIADVLKQEWKVTREQ